MRHRTCITYVYTCCAGAGTVERDVNNAVIVYQRAVVIVGCKLHSVVNITGTVLRKLICQEQYCGCCLIMLWGRKEFFASSMVSDDGDARRRLRDVARRVQRGATCISVRGARAHGADCAARGTPHPAPSDRVTARLSTNTE